MMAGQMRGRRKILLEVCVDSVASAVAAEKGGADRIELCSCIAAGGVTPSAGLIELVRKELSIKVHVLIRPRAGGFVYSRKDVATMLRDIAFAKNADVDGVVIGALKRDRSFDLPVIRALMGAARPMRVGVHRAFDVCADPHRALEQLLGIGVDAILTSGQKPSALKGLDLLADLHTRAAGRVELIAAGKITTSTAPRIARVSGIRSLHAWSGVVRTVPETRPDGFYSAGSLEVVDAAKVRSLKKSLKARKQAGFLE